MSDRPIHEESVIQVMKYVDQLIDNDIYNNVNLLIKLYKKVIKTQYKYIRSLPDMDNTVIDNYKELIEAEIIEHRVNYTDMYVMVL